MKRLCFIFKQPLPLKQPLTWSLTSFLLLLPPFPFSIFYFSPFLIHSHPFSSPSSRLRPLTSPSDITAHYVFGESSVHRFPLVHPAPPLFHLLLLRTFASQIMVGLSVHRNIVLFDQVSGWANDHRHLAGITMNAIKQVTILLADQS